MEERGLRVGGFVPSGGDLRGSLKGGGAAGFEGDKGVAHSIEIGGPVAPEDPELVISIEAGCRASKL